MESNSQTTTVYQDTSVLNYFSVESTTEIQEVAKTGIPDPYFTEFDPKLEHQKFKVK